MNQVIKTILNLFIFFVKGFLANKLTKSKQASKKHTGDIGEQKQKRQRFYALKKHLRGKSCLFAYLRVCAFYVRSVPFCACKFFSFKKSKLS